nr:helix-turn-helix domain-containing protein [uncultured Roseateles sp.]
MSALQNRLENALAYRKTLGPEPPARINKSQLAKACKVKPASVADWFNGTTQRLRAETSLLAAAYLKVNADWLATGRGSMTDPAAQQARSVAEPPAQWAEIRPRVSVGELANLIAVAVSDLSYARRKSLADSLTVLALNGPDPDQVDVINTLANGLEIEAPAPALVSWHQAALGVAEHHPDVDKRPSYVQFVRDVARYMAEQCGITPQKAPASAPVSQ